MASDGRVHHYQSVREEERDEIDDLDAHIEDTIDLDEKDYLNTPPRPPRRTRAVELLRRYRWMIDGFLVALVIMLLLDRHWTRDEPVKEIQNEGGGDITGFAPRCKSPRIVVAAEYSRLIWVQFLRKSSHSSQIPCSFPKTDPSSSQMKCARNG